MAFYEDLKASLPCVTQSSSLNWVDCQSTDTYPTDIYRDDITFSNLFSEDILVHSSNTVHPIISSSSAVAADDDDDVDDDDNGDANMLCTLQYGTGNNPSVYTTSSECDHYKKCRSYSEYDLFPIKSRHYDDEDYKSHRHSLYPSKRQPGKHLISRKGRRFKEQLLTTRETDKTNNNNNKNNNFSSSNNLFNPLPCENSTDPLSSIPIEIDEQNTQPFITNLISSDYSHPKDEMSIPPITSEQFATATTTRTTTIIHNDEDKYSIISVMNSYQLDPASPSLADKACTLSQLAKSRRYIIDSWCILPVSNQKIHSNIFLSNDTILGKHSSSSASPSSYSSWSASSSSSSSSSSPSPSSLISSLSALNVNCDSSIYRSSLDLLKSSSSSYIHYRDHPMSSLDHIRKIRRRSKRRIRPLSSFFQPSLTKVSEEGSSISSTDSGSDSLPSDTQHPIKDNNNNSSKDFKELQDLFPSLSVSIYDYKRRHESPPDRQSKSSNMAFEISPSQNLLSSLETSKVNDNHHCGDTGDSISNQQYDEELIKSLEVTTHNLNANNYYENNNDENNRDVTDGTTAGDHVISNKCDNDATEGDKSSRALFPRI